MKRAGNSRIFREAGTRSPAESVRGELTLLQIHCNKYSKSQWGSIVEFFHVSQGYLALTNVLFVAH